MFGYFLYNDIYLKLYSPDLIGELRETIVTEPLLGLSGGVQGVLLRLTGVMLLQALPGLLFSRSPQAALGDIAVAVSMGKTPII